MNILRIVFIIATITLAACSSWWGGKNKGSARMYDGDTSPTNKMYDESPGSPLHN